MKRPLVLVVLLVGVAEAQTLADFPPDILCYAHIKSLHEQERVTMGFELKRRDYTCTPEDVTKGHESFIRWRQAEVAKTQRETLQRALSDPRIAPTIQPDAPPIKK